MKRLAPILAICALAASGGIIDRIAVSVGTRVITTSDISREIRVTAFLNGTKVDLSPAARRAAADRMVEQALIRMEIVNSRYPEPSMDEVKPIFEQFRKLHYPDDGAYQAALKQYGITEQDVLQELLWQRTLLSFIDVRFRPSVNVTDEQIQEYFEKTVKPAAEAAHPGQPVTLDEYRSRIEETLIGQQEDAAMNQWVASAKTRNDIVFRDEAFQ